MFATPANETITERPQIDHTIGNQRKNCPANVGNWGRECFQVRSCSAELRYCYFSLKISDPFWRLGLFRHWFTFASISIWAKVTFARNFLVLSPTINTIDTPTDLPSLAWICLNKSVMHTVMSKVIRPNTNKTRNKLKWPKTVQFLNVVFSCLHQCRHWRMPGHHA